MDKSADKSIALSKICTVLFSVLLAALDLAAYWVIRWYLAVSRSLDGFGDEIFLFAVLYLCSACAWVLLFHLWRLLGNLRKSRVFVLENVRALQISSLCCAGVFLVCGLGAIHYFPLIAFSAAAGFLALILRILQNVFQQATAMKSELDLTV